MAARSAPDIEDPFSPLRLEAIGHLGCLPKSSESEALRDLVKKVLERDS